MSCLSSTRTRPYSIERVECKGKERKVHCSFTIRHLSAQTDFVKSHKHHAAFIDNSYSYFRQPVIILLWLGNIMIVLTTNLSAI